MEVGSLFRIKTVRTEEGELQYYEIHPSAPLLDQISNYFLLVPNDWREEVKQLTGKRASSYTYELLLWLRLQYEQIRRYNSGKNRKKKPFKIFELPCAIHSLLLFPLVPVISSTRFKVNKPSVNPTVDIIKANGKITFNTSKDNSTFGM